MSKVKTRSKLMSLSALLMFLFTVGCTPHTTGATEVGVRTNSIGIGGGRGVSDTIYPPGSTTFFPPIVTHWHLFDTALQNLAMTRELSGDRAGDDSLQFKTIDGNDISVNVTVSWRIDPQLAPYLLRFVGDSTREVGDRLVRPVSRTMLRDVLNELSSEEYYNSELRFEKAEEGRSLLNHYLSGEGVVIEQVLLGEHRFNDRYETVIRDKKLAEQNAARYRSETEAVEQQMSRQLETARGDVQEAIEEARGTAERRVLESDAIYFERERQAQALLTERSAMAEGLRERARALAGPGGQNMVKLEIARALLGRPLVFMPGGSGMDLRNTNVNELLDRYGAERAQQGSR